MVLLLAYQLGSLEFRQLQFCYIHILRTYYLPFFLVFLAAALSTKFGYGLPAAFALAFAFAFCVGVKGLEVLLGFFLSQNSFFTCYLYFS